MPEVVTTISGRGRTSRRAYAAATPAAMASTGSP